MDVHPLTKQRQQLHVHAAERGLAWRTGRAVG